MSSFQVSGLPAKELELLRLGRQRLVRPQVASFIGPHDELKVAGHAAAFPSAPRQTGVRLQHCRREVGKIAVRVRVRAREGSQQAKERKVEHARQQAHTVRHRWWSSVGTAASGARCGSRDALYKMLRGERKPQHETVVAILAALSTRLAAEAITTK